MSNPNRYTCDLLIVDGRHLLYRSADVNRGLTATVGDDVIPAGGVHGFLTVLAKLKRRYQGIIAVAWEGKDNFRFKLYPEYKRKPTPEPEMRVFYDELGAQEQLLIPILSHLGVRQFRGVECEADDVIGTLCSTLRGDEHHHGARRIAVFSGDSDLRQLVRGDDVVVLAPGFKGGETKYNEDAVVDRHGVRPDQIPALKAIAGDGSDNIPGVRGIGEKGAAKMVTAYEDLSGVIAAAKNGKWTFTERQRTMISDASADLELFLKLTTIKCDVELLAAPVEFDVMEARKLMHRLQFKRLLEHGSFTDLKRLGRA